MTREVTMFIYRSLEEVAAVSCLYTAPYRWEYPALVLDSPLYVAAITAERGPIMAHWFLPAVHHGTLQYGPPPGKSGLGSL